MKTMSTDFFLHLIDWNVFHAEWWKIGFRSWGYRCSELQQMKFQFIRSTELSLPVEFDKHSVYAIITMDIRSNARLVESNDEAKEKKKNP